LIGLTTAGDREYPPNPPRVDLPLHTRKVAGSIPAGTTTCRRGSHTALAAVLGRRRITPTSRFIAGVATTTATDWPMGCAVDSRRFAWTSATVGTGSQSTRI